MPTERTRLSDDDLRRDLAGLPDWSLADGKLHREYKFRDFIHAFGFMAASATAIEKLDHHPEWFNVYGRVVVDLETHSAGGITPMDVKLAHILEDLAKKLL